MNLPHLSWLEGLGYLASIIIMTSMLMSSIVKLRWINLLGSFLFTLYGFLIGALPVGFLNGFIVIINLVHLFRMYKRKEYFKLLEIKPNDRYFMNFLVYYKEEIEKLFPSFDPERSEAHISIFILRNMAIAGVFLARETEKPETLEVILDFVIPEYRDFKLGRFLFYDNKSYFTSRGYRVILATSRTEEHARYLRKMKFVRGANEGVWTFRMEM